MIKNKSIKKIAEIICNIENISNFAFSEYSNYCLWSFV